MGVEFGEGTGFAEALFDNDAEWPDELPFRRGDILQVLDRNPANGLAEGWWLCMNQDGRDGIAPANRLRMIRTFENSKNQIITPRRFGDLFSYTSSSLDRDVLRTPLTLKNPIYSSLPNRFRQFCIFDDSGNQSASDEDSYDVPSPQLRHEPVIRKVPIRIEGRPPTPHNVYAKSGTDSGISDMFYDEVPKNNNQNVTTLRKTSINGSVGSTNREGDKSGGGFGDAFDRTPFLPASAGLYDSVSYAKRPVFSNGQAGSVPIPDIFVPLSNRGGTGGGDSTLVKRRPPNVASASSSSTLLKDYQNGYSTANNSDSSNSTSSVGSASFLSNDVSWRADARNSNDHAASAASSSPVDFYDVPRDVRAAAAAAAAGSSGKAAVTKENSRSCLSWKPDAKLPKATLASQPYLSATSTLRGGVTFSPSVSSPDAVQNRAAVAAMTRSFVDAPLATASQPESLYDVPKSVAVSAAAGINNHVAEDRLSTSSVSSHETDILEMTAAAAANRVDAFGSADEAVRELKALIEGINTTLSAVVNLTAVPNASSKLFTELWDGNGLKDTCDLLCSNFHQLMDCIAGVVGTAARNRTMLGQSGVKVSDKLLDLMHPVRKTVKLLTKIYADVLKYSAERSSTENLNLLSQFVSLAKQVPEDSAPVLAFIYSNAASIFVNQLSADAGSSGVSGGSCSGIGSSDNNAAASGGDESDEKSSLYDDYDFVDAKCAELHKKTAGSSSSTNAAGTDGGRPGLTSLCTEDVQILQFYRPQVDSHIQCLSDAIDKFLAIVEENKPPKIFIGHCKFVILAAHKLVYIGDSIAQCLKFVDMREKVKACSDSLSEMLKHCVMATKQAALQYPAIPTIQAMVDSMVSVSHAAHRLRMVINQ